MNELPAKHTAFTATATDCNWVGENYMNTHIDDRLFVPRHDGPQVDELNWQTELLLRQLRRLPHHVELRAPRNSRHVTPYNKRTCNNLFQADSDS